MAMIQAPVFRSYAEWDAYLQEKQVREVTSNTVVMRDREGQIAILYYGTKLLVYGRTGLVWLYNGGYYNTSTKERIARWCPADMTISVKKGAWFVLYRDKTYAFKDGMMFDTQAGILIDEGEQVEDLRALLEEIHTYVCELTKQILARIQEHTEGDCWDCGMLFEAKRHQSLEEKREHYRLHFTEKYYCWSMLVNAYRELGQGHSAWEELLQEDVENGIMHPIQRRLERFLRSETY